MGILFDNNRFVKLADRTLPEIISAKRGQDKGQLTEFCRLLKRLGVDLIEIDYEVLRVMEKLPGGVDFIFRLRCVEEMSLLSLHNIRQCIVGSDVLASSCLEEFAAQHQLKLWVEFDVQELSQLDSINLQGKYQGGKYQGGILETVRLIGFSRCIDQTWVQQVRQLRQRLKVSIDICADDSCFTGVATALEAGRGGLDWLTLSFAGYGRTARYAPLEQVILAATLAYGVNKQPDLSYLPGMSRIFSDCTGQRIPGNQPALGQNIFRYESGIHADGINKNPVTYEPYSPGRIGQERKLAIGKHSGAKSIISKLAELGLQLADNKIPPLLYRIKEASIRLGRDLTDEEFTKLFTVR